VLTASVAAAAAAAAGCGDFENATWTGTVEADPSHGLWVNYAVVGEELVVGIGANASGVGYVGLGIGEQASGSMIGADVVTVALGGGTGPVVQDRFVPFTAFPFKPLEGFEELDISPLPFPELDLAFGGCEDWTLVEAVETEECHQVTLKRKLVTNDENDRDIVPGETYPVLWALSESTSVEYHGSNRGALSIDFSRPYATNTQVTCDDCETVILQMDNVEIDARETQYMCQSFSIPDDNLPAHTIAIYPQIDQTKFVHHILVHGCKPDSGLFRDHISPQKCQGSSEGISPLGNQDCPVLISGWAPGQDGLILPEEAGIRITSDLRHFVVEIHYNNPLLESNVIDNTAIAFVMTRTLRPNDLGTIVVGDPATGSDSLRPGQTAEHRVGVCDQACTSLALEGTEGLTIMGSFLHMHSFGRRMWTNHYSKDMEFKGEISRVDFWNFETQRTSTVGAGRKLLPGDQLFTHCSYDTTKWDSNVRFGQGSLDEMCMDFVYYYAPSLPTIEGEQWTLCGGGRGILRGAGLINVDTTLLEALVFPTFPNVRARMVVNICNQKIVGDYSETFFGEAVPIQRPDPRAWDEERREWDSSVTFGTGSVDESCAASDLPEKTETVSSDPRFAFQRDLLPDVRMYWKVVDEDTDRCYLSLRLTSTGDEWLSFGLGSSMTNSDVIVVVNGVSTERTIGNARSSAAIQLYDGESGVFGSLVETEEDGSTTLYLNATSLAGTALKLPCGESSRRRLAADTTENFIVAKGSGATFTVHETTARGSVSWDGALSSASSIDTALLITLHAAAMLAGFGVLLPLTILFPLLRKPSEEAWFHAHKLAVKVLVVFVVVGTGLGFVVTASHMSLTHHVVGLAAIFVLFLNPIVGASRPPKTATSRALWQKVHHFIALCAAGLGVGAVILGAELVASSRQDAFLGTSSPIVAWISAGITVASIVVGNFVRTRQETIPTATVAKEIPEL